MILDNIFGVEQRGMTVSGVPAGSDYFKDPTFQKKFWGTYGPTAAGVNVTEDSAQTLSAVYAANRLLSSTVAALPRMVYRREGNEGDKKPDRDNDLYKLLHDRPNPVHTPIQYAEIGMQFLMMWGRSLSYIETTNGGKPKALWPIHTNHVKRGWRDGAPAYLLDNVKDTDLFPAPPTTKKVLLAHEVLDVATFDGKSIITHAREQIGEALAAQQFGAGFYAGGAQPMIALIDKSGGLDQTGVENLRKQWEEMHGGSKRNIAVLQEDFDVKTIGMPLNDAQFLESRGFYVTEIARWFGVPPHKIADLSKATFSNIEEQQLEFYENLIPWLVRWEQELHYKLFRESERSLYLVQHLVENLLKGNIEKRYQAYSTGLQWGFLNRNEVRRRENLNSMGEEGDVHMVPSNMVPADGTKPDETGGGMGGKPIAGDAKAAPADKPAAEPVAADAEQDVKVSEDLVLNGAQITAATAIVTAVAIGDIPLDAGLGQLEILFNLSKEQAKQIMGSAGTDTPTTPNPIDKPEGETSEPKEPPEEEGDKKATGDIPAAARAALQGAVAKMVRKETEKVCLAAKEPKKFLDWLDRFYGERAWPAKMTAGVKPAADACEALGMKVAMEPALGAHCRRSLAALLELSGKLTPANFAKGVEKELSTWEIDLSKPLTTTLFQEK